jgi:hypothetical protein
VVVNSEPLVRRKAVATDTGNDDDPELERKEVEIETLRVEKEQRLQDLERREGEGGLSKAIAEQSRPNMRESWFIRNEFAAKKQADNIRGNEYPGQESHKLLSVPWSLMVGHGMIFNVPIRLGTLSVMWNKAFFSHD